ncbi:hypothetical protein E2C01_049254 [Portunus trituberculatus]|uniref:Uncharacterized protein n=1 Tax=Portunus trituberculatus TaxID=210409 RepID=A0A5B7G8X7_PORTR|nr:hypothetical protein [Portunus trituberculatus]
MSVINSLTICEALQHCLPRPRNPHAIPRQPPASHAFSCFAHAMPLLSARCEYGAQDNRSQNMYGCFPLCLPANRKESSLGNINQ